jgi:hypothetical protein
VIKKKHIINFVYLSFSYKGSNVEVFVVIVFIMSIAFICEQYVLFSIYIPMLSQNIFQAYLINMYSSSNICMHW